MNNSLLFKQAHAMTKAVILPNESYSVVFGQCLKIIKANALAQEAKNKNNEFFLCLVYVLAILVCMFFSLLSATETLIAVAGTITAYVFLPFVSKFFENNACQRIEPVLF